MMRYILLFGFFVLFPRFADGGGNHHKYYISLTEAHFRPESELVELSMRTFTDDLNAVLQQFCNCDASIDHPGKALDKHIRKYISHSFRANGEPSDVEFLGFENEADLTHLYFTIKPPSKEVQMGVHFLMDLYPDQVNIVNLHAPNRSPSFYYNSRDQEEQWDLY